MPSTFTDGKIVYSVDFMFAYINIFKPKSREVDITKIKFDINRICWARRTLSPMDVLRNPDKYKDEYERIINSDLKYPIIVD